MEIIPIKSRYFANQFSNYEEKVSHSIVDSLCLRYRDVVMQIKFGLPQLRRNTQIPERDTLLIG